MQKDFLCLEVECRKTPEALRVLHQLEQEQPYVKLIGWHTSEMSQARLLHCYDDVFDVACLVESYL